jgi:hypothetical protein
MEIKRFLFCILLQLSLSATAHSISLGEEMDVTAYMEGKTLYNSEMVWKSSMAISLPMIPTE